MNDEQAVAELVAHFGEGSGMPTAKQWADILAGPAEAPLCIINLVKLRTQAEDGSSIAAARTGLEAFLQYGAGSLPRINAAGGTMAFSGRIAGQLVGDDADDWDLGVVVRWPNRRAMLSLFQDPAYRAAFPHRRAAVARYRATVITAAG